MSRYFLGIDGGQSSTTAMIGDETGRVLGLGRGGPCNHVRTGDGRERFRTAIEDSVRGAVDSAAMTNPSFESVCAGLSGGPADKEAMVREMIPAAKHLITNDAVIALSGATAGEPGVIAIAGTGSIAFGRNAEGRTARAGGWGYAFGDEGGAFDLVRQALRASLRFEEGWGPETALREALIESVGPVDGGNRHGEPVRSSNDLLHRFYTSEFPRARIASFAPLVDRAAQHGDPVARDILHSAAQSLATYVAAVRRQLFHRGEPVRFSYIGGVFRSAILLERFRMLVELEGDGGCAAPIYGPAVGALLLAWHAAGLHVTPAGIPANYKG